MRICDASQSWTAQIIGQTRSLNGRARTFATVLADKGALPGLRVGGVVDFDFVHAFKVERRAALAAINLKSVVIAPATTKSRRFKNSDAAVFELSKEVGVVIHGDFAFPFFTLRAPSACARAGQRPLIDKRGHLTDGGCNRAIQVLGEINGVGYLARIAAEMRHIDPDVRFLVELYTLARKAAGF